MPQTPADELRAAAQQLMDLADAAQDNLDTADYWRTYDKAAAWREGFVNGFGGPWADLVAVFTPATAYAIARWLRSWTGVELNEHGPMPEDAQHALAVARQILGTTTTETETPAAETIRLRGSGDLTEQDRKFAAEIVRAAKRKYAAEHPNPPALADPVMTSDQWATIHELTAWLDRHDGRGEAAVSARMLKLSEEAGEAAQAWIGMTGHNPRKGVSHTVGNLAAELCDVIVAAAIVLDTLTDDPAKHLDAKLGRIAERTRTAEEPTP